MVMIVVIGQGNNIKKLFFFIILLSLFTNCSIRKKRLVHFLSTLENLKVLPPTKEEAIIIEKLQEDARKFSEKCEREGRNCFICESSSSANFKTGVTEFRKIIFDQFKVNAGSKEGENKILVTIGKQNNIESTEFLKYTDEDSKRQIEEMFKSKELNQWRSAINSGFPVKTQFEISIFIEKRYK